MGTVEIDYGIQARLDLYMPRQAGRTVSPDDVIYICGDIVKAQDQLKLWQMRHQDVSNQLDLGNGKIGIRVYYSMVQDIDFDIQRRKWHAYLVRIKKRGGERRQME